MKNFIFSIGLAMLCVTGHAQENNKYNQRGVDFNTSVGMIQADYYAGKVKEFNDETVRKYSKAIPLQNQASMELVTTITKTLKAPNYNFLSEVAKCNLSSYGKQKILGLFRQKDQTQDDYNKMLSNQASEITKAEISPREKELLLSLVAITYNYVESTHRTNNATCYITGEDGTSTIPCSLAGAMIGGIIGFQVCGILCALGGAVIGAVLGSIC